MTHWTNYLVEGFRVGQTSDLTITVDPDTDAPSAVVVASRLRGLYEALKHGREGLGAEDTDDLLCLADHLHHVIGRLSGMEDEVLLELRDRGVGSRKIASAWDEADHKKVLRRYGRIERAREQGLSSSTLLDIDETEIQD